MGSASDEVFIGLGQKEWYWPLQGSQDTHDVWTVTHATTYQEIPTNFFLLPVLFLYAKVYIRFMSWIVMFMSALMVTHADVIVFSLETGSLVNKLWINGA